MKTTSPTLLWVVAFGLGVVTSCRGVSEDPLARGTGATDGKAGATSTGGGGSSAGVTGSGGLGDPGGASVGGKSEPSGGDGGVPTSLQGGSGDGNGPNHGIGEGGSAGDSGGIGEGGSAGDGGGIGEGGSAGDGGGIGEGGSAGDNRKDLTRCSSAAPFGTPQRVLGLPDGAVRLRLNPSETVGHYARFPTTGSLADLEVTKRASRGDAFSTGISLNTNDSGWDFSPTLPGDGAIIYFESRGNNLSWRIHQSVWDPAQQAFGSVDLVAGLGASGSHGSDGGPYTLPSGEALYFHSDRFGMNLMRAERIGTSFSHVTTVPITFPPGLIFTTACPVVAPDELTIYFVAQDSATRTDIWTATRATKADSFGEAAPVVEVNTDLGNEVPSFISADGCRLYFDRNSNVPFGWTPPGNSFVAEREPDSE